nr:unnamed protein product [Digitaria exilis]
MVMGYNKKLAMESFVLCLMIFMEVVVPGAAAGIRQPPPMYVFGDSTLDVGNNNYLPGPKVPKANVPYYGIDFPGVPSGRFSNGYNAADYVAKTIGFGSSPPPYLLLAQSSSLLISTALKIGASYASAGAGILDSTNAGKSIPLSKQVQYLNATKTKMVAQVGSSAANAVLARSFFLIGIGGNDINAFASAQQSDAAAFYDSLISTYSAAITDLYTMGARKFAIINGPLAGCLPFVRVLDAAGSCSDDRNKVAAGFNERLASLLAGLATKLPGFVYSLADSYGNMVDTFADPKASGFTDIADACCGAGRFGGEAGCTPNSTLCGDRDKYYFWDRVHPSQRGAMLKAQAFYDGLPRYTTPINFKQLLHHK